MFNRNPRFVNSGGKRRAPITPFFWRSVIAKNGLYGKMERSFGKMKR
jgi:hypothetical protein